MNQDDYQRRGEGRGRGSEYGRGDDRHEEGYRGRNTGRNLGAQYDRDNDPYGRYGNRESQGRYGGERDWRSGREGQDRGFRGEDRYEQEMGRARGEAEFGLAGYGGGFEGGRSGRDWPDQPRWPGYGSSRSGSDAFEDDLRMSSRGIESDYGGGYGGRGGMGWHSGGGGYGGRGGMGSDYRGGRGQRREMGSDYGGDYGGRSGTGSDYGGGYGGRGGTGSDYGGGYGGRGGMGSDYGQGGRGQSGRGQERDWGSGQRSQRMDPKGYTRSDERVREDVCETLSRSGLDVREVSVQVKDGHVTLDGTVHDRRAKHDIENCVDDCGGVKDIDNRIRVSRNESQAGGAQAGGAQAGGMQAGGVQGGGGKTGQAAQQGTQSGNNQTGTGGATPTK